MPNIIYLFYMEIYRYFVISCCLISRHARFVLSVQQCGNASLSWANAAPRLRGGLATCLKLNYPSLIGDLETRDIARRLGNTAGVLPYTVPIGSDGQLKTRLEGNADPADIEGRFGALALKQGLWPAAARLAIEIPPSHHRPRGDGHRFLIGWWQPAAVRSFASLMPPFALL